jgi:hypothetical protein
MYLCLHISVDLWRSRDSAPPWSMNWPCRSTKVTTAISGHQPDDFQEWWYMTRLAYERKVDTPEGLIRHTVNAATHIRGRHALLDVIRSAAKLARNCTEDEGG